MPRTPEQIVRRIADSTRPGFRGRLLARGLARNLLWSAGQLPEGRRPFAASLTSDLLAYGLGLFRLGLELRSQDKENPAISDCFARAGEAIEAVVRDGDPNFNERGFYTLVAAAAYHLAHFSARAFSLFPSRIETLNLSPSERALTFLMRRDFNSLHAVLLAESGPVGFDSTLTLHLSQLEEGTAPQDEEGAALDQPIYLTLNALFFKALAVFDFALETGDMQAVENCLEILDEGIAAAGDFLCVTFWWVFTITRHLLDDLWGESLHVGLPSLPPSAPDSEWNSLRWLFICKLLKRNRAEVELWPSQLAAAARAVDPTDDLVAALPTSAGKTRIAELCILRALSLHQRVVFVTPLRALSAQTEKALRETFGAFGFSISSLYGSSGVVGEDIDSLKNRDIVVSTPEKLDFALRNDAELLEDVGLIVLDEAHTIGAGEREVRYEVLVQRLLRRDDSERRRIVCLSAILPQGEQLQDFLAWIRQDQEGDAISVNWRPTRQRFGEIRWDGNRALLWFRVDGADPSDAPYIDNFVSQRPPLGTQRKKLPRDRRDLCLMSAWRLVQEGQTVLIYCPERRSVIPAAEALLDLVRRGYLAPLLDESHADLADALNIGREWLGDNHPAVQCLRIGVAVHHGHLPRPFLRAVERLLKTGLLKVTISSPTLAQGLNLSATTVLFSALNRHGKLIKGEEFANVAGRAGRAFVDVEGQVLCVAWEGKHLREWDRLLRAARERSLKSGLLQLILDFCLQIEVRKGISRTEVLEYVLNNANVWVPPRPQNLLDEDQEKEQKGFERKWAVDLACLDWAILSIVQHDVELADITTAIDEALRSSLWERSLKREDEHTRRVSKEFLMRRAGFIWSNSTALQRKGYFFAGVSFDTGKFLDHHAGELNQLLTIADRGFASGDMALAIKATTGFARIVFQTAPFQPDDMLEHWEKVLAEWVSGESLSDFAGGKDAEVIDFVEGAFVYRLVWAMEAVRVRKVANDGDSVGENSGRTALAVETGTFHHSAALLIQSGLSSRIAAMKAVKDCPADFQDVRGLRGWLRSAQVRDRESEPDWPTPETASLWRLFVEGLKTNLSEKWEIQSYGVNVDWTVGSPPSGTPVRLIYISATKQLEIRSVEMEALGFLPFTLDAEPSGVPFATVSDGGETLSITYIGPHDFLTHG